MKYVYDDGAIVEIRVWSVPRSAAYPDGVRYSLAYVLPEVARPTVLFDNHAGKGHHRHLGNQEAPYAFTDVEQLVEDFLAEVTRVRGGGE